MDLSLIEELVRRYGRLILPELGAFLVDNFESGYALERVTFSPFLRYNDGKFEQYLEIDYGFSRPRAIEEVRHCVEYIRSVLEAQGKCELPKLGALVQSSIGQISFFTALHKQDTNTVEGSEILTTSEHPSVSFDIPLISEIEKPTTAMVGGCTTISDGSLSTITTPPIIEERCAAIESENVESAAETAFSLDEMLLGVKTTEYATPAVIEDTLSTANENFLDTMLASPVEAKSKGGFDIDTCVEALESLEKASGRNEETGVEQAPPSQDLDVNCTTDTTEQTISQERFATYTAQENFQNKESGSGIHVSETETTGVESSALNTPWVATSVTRPPHKKHLGFWISLVLLVVVGGIVSDFFWFKEFTPYLLATLEEHGIVLQEPPSVMLNPVATNTVTETQSATPEVVASTSTQFEKEFQERVAEQEKSTLNNKEQLPQHPNTLQEASKDKLRTLPVSPRGHFYLVFGCFRSSLNADNYLDETKRAGFQTQIIKQESGMHAVVMGAYTTRIEAASVLTTVRDQYPNVWILKL